MVTFTVIIFESPYAKERALSALRFAWTADLEGAKTGQKPAQGVTNYGQMLADLIAGDVEVKACGVCAEARGLAQTDLLDGVKLATIHDLVEWTTNSDKVLTF